MSLLVQDVDGAACRLVPRLRQCRARLVLDWSMKLRTCAAHFEIRGGFTARPKVDKPNSEPSSEELGLAMELSDIAAETSWPEQARQADEAMQQPDLHGLASAPAVRRRIAELAGFTDSTLHKRISARKFIERRHPDSLPALSADTPLRPLLILSRIDKASPSLAAELLPGTLSGMYSVRDLKRRLDYLRTERSSRLEAGSAGEIARPVGEWRAFHSAAGAFLERHLHLLTDLPEAKLFAAQRNRTIPADYVVVAAGREVAVIEIKSFQSNFYKRHAVELLGVLALHAAQGVDVWLLLPATWQSGLKTLFGQVELLELPVGIRIATLDPEAKELDAFAVVRRT